VSQADEGVRKDDGEKGKQVREEGYSDEGLRAGAEEEE
jgi:hypothetical protein